MENIIYKGYTIKIDQDQDLINPRDDDNLGKMICFHNNYTLGDKHDYATENYGDYQDLAKDIQKEEQAIIMLPLYLYDHSGISIKIGNYNGLLPQGHAEFDTMRVGWILVSRKSILTWYQAKRLTKKLLDQARKILEQEVKTYNQYLMGDIYNYNIAGEDESCSGFYGYDYCLEEAKNVVDCIIKNKAKLRQQKTKKYIQGNVPIVYRQ